MHSFLQVFGCKSHLNWLPQMQFLNVNFGKPHLHFTAFCLALTHVVTLSEPLNSLGAPGEALDTALQPRDLTLAHQQRPRDLHKPEEVGDEKWKMRGKQTNRQDKLYSKTFSGIIIFWEKKSPLRDFTSAIKSLIAKYLDFKLKFYLRLKMFNFHRVS